VRYCRPAMFTVVSQPFLRQRHAVQGVTPTCSSHLHRLMKLASMLYYGTSHTIATPPSFVLYFELHHTTLGKFYENTKRFRAVGCSTP
jgi:hypothetical protein